MSTAARYDETLVLPRAVRFPIEMIPPDGFDAARLETWPSVTGRLEYMDGRLLYMPPCGDEQQDTVTDVVITLGGWVRSHPDHVLGTNEAGMRLSGATRAADAAIWRRADLGAYSGDFRRVPPVLAVEVAGNDTSDTESALREKATWYVRVGVRVVWLVLPSTRSAVVVTAESAVDLGPSDRFREIPELSGLSPSVRELFVQIDAKR